MAGLYRINEAMELELTKLIKQATTAEEVMWDKQDAFVDDLASVKPTNKPFIVLSIISGPIPVSDIEYTPVGDEPGMFNISRIQKFTLSVNIYTNNGHLEKAATLAMLLRSEFYKNKMRAVGLGLWDTLNISDISIFDETRHNLRSHIDFVFSYISIQENVNLGEIDRVRVEGTAGDNDIVVDVHK